jgi:hypothetical protein
MSSIRRCSYLTAPTTKMRNRGLMVQSSDHVKGKMSVGIIPYASSLKFGFPPSFIYLLENVLEPVNKSSKYKHDVLRENALSEYQYKLKII